MENAMTTLEFFQANQIDKLDGQVFTHNIDDLVDEMKIKKCNALRFITKNFKIGVHYERTEVKRLQHSHGGNNKIMTMLTADAYELFKTSFNMKNKYAPHYGNVVQVRILMTLENQTIGYIATVLEGVVTVERQAKIGPYKVDMLFTDSKLVVECDEIGHADRDKKYEDKREQFLITLGYKVFRFNPNDVNFDMAFVLRDIIQIIFGKSDKDALN